MGKKSSIYVMNTEEKRAMYKKKVRFLEDRIRYLELELKKENDVKNHYFEILEELDKERNTYTTDYRPGEYILYILGNIYHIGRVKSVTDRGAFVYYHEGDTASMTPFKYMRKISNAHCIRLTSLGGLPEWSELPDPKYCNNGDVYYESI